MMCTSVDCVHSTLSFGATASTRAVWVSCFDLLRGHHCGLEMAGAALTALAASLQVCPAGQVS